MSKKCPVCRKRFGKRALSIHLERVHGEVENHFVCFDDCVKCCTGLTLPTSISIQDIKKIADHLNITPVEVFSKYCIIGAQTYQDSITTFFSILDFPSPCRFLKDMRCSIYPARPSSCITFPYKVSEESTKNLYLNYKCVEKGLINFSHKETKYLEEIYNEGSVESNETMNFFNYTKYQVNIDLIELNLLLPEFNRKTGLLVKEVEVVGGDKYDYIYIKTDVVFEPKKNNTIFREMVHNLAVPKLKELVGNDFLKKIESIS